MASILLQPCCEQLFGRPQRPPAKSGSWMALFRQFSRQDAAEELCGTLGSRAALTNGCADDPCATGPTISRATQQKFPTPSMTVLRIFSRYKRSLPGHSHFFPITPQPPLTHPVTLRPTSHLLVCIETGLSSLTSSDCTASR